MQSGSKGLYTVVLLGTSGVGKSSIAFYLEHGYPPPRSIKPTIAFGISHIVIDKSIIGLIDVGGQRKFLDMRYHERFVRTADGLVFVVDSTQRNFKYDEEWLENALELISDQIPIIVIANKQDLPTALSPDFLKTNIFDKILKTNSYHIFGTVAADPGGVRSGENVEQAFKYLVNILRRNQEFTIKQSQV